MSDMFDRDPSVYPKSMEDVGQVIDPEQESLRKRLLTHQKAEREREVKEQEKLNKEREKEKERNKVVSKDETIKLLHEKLRSLGVAPPAELETKSEEYEDSPKAITGGQSKDPYADAEEFFGKLKDDAPKKQVDSKKPDLPKKPQHSKLFNIEEQYRKEAAEAYEYPESRSYDATLKQLERDEKAEYNDFKDLVEEAQSKFQATQNKLNYIAAIETIAQAFAQYKMAENAAAKGVDVSGFKFDKSDFSRFHEQNQNRLKHGLKLIEQGHAEAIVRQNRTRAEVREKYKKIERDRNEYVQLLRDQKALDDQAKAGIVADERKHAQKKELITARATEQIRVKRAVEKKDLDYSEEIESMVEGDKGDAHRMQMIKLLQDEAEILDVPEAVVRRVTAEVSKEVPFYQSIYDENAHVQALRTALYLEVQRYKTQDTAQKAAGFSPADEREIQKVIEFNKQKGRTVSREQAIYTLRQAKKIK